MNRNPLYLDTSVGGLTPVTTPDKLDPSIIPDQTTNDAALTSAAHLVVSADADEMSYIMGIISDYDELIYRVIAFDGTNYYFPDYTAESITGLSLGVIVKPDLTEWVVIQLSGVVTPVVCSGHTTAISYPNDQLFLGASGEPVVTVGNTEVTNNRIITLRSFTMPTNQAIVSGGISSTGLTITSQAGTTVTIGEGSTNHVLSYPSISNLTTVPASSVSWVYVKPDSTYTVSTKEYIVVPTEQYLDVDRQLGTIATGGRSSNLVVSGNDIRSTATSSWAAGYCTNPISSTLRYQYYQFTYLGGTSNTMVGVATINTGTVSNLALSAQGGAINSLVYWSFVSSTGGFAKQAGSTDWTIHYATTSAVGSVAKVHGILIDHQLRKVYWSVDGVWLNGGAAVATQSGSPSYPIRPCFSTANNPGYITFNSPSTYTFPVRGDYYYYNKTANNTYTYDYTSGTPTPVYTPTMLLGRVITDAIGVQSIDSPPYNNTYTEQFVLDELANIYHFTRSAAPTISVSQEVDINYTATSNLDTAYVSADRVPSQPTNITVTA